jgi:hypothetical protein
MLKWFNKTRYASLGEALGDIYKELQSLQPQDSADIVWSKTGSGMSALRKGSTASSGMSTDIDMTNPAKVKAVSGEYNSYFKIIDSSETSADGTVTHKVSIVDGYDRGSNRCKVNNKVYDLQYHTEAVTATSIIALRFSSSAQKVEYYFSTDTLLPDDTSAYSYCQIGTVTIKDSVMAIQQDHLCGIAQMFWYDICGD